MKDLGRERWLLRYRHNDGLGVPTAAFMICTFWLVEALAVAGRIDEAREALRHAVRLHVAARPAVGGLGRDDHAHVGQLPAGLLARGLDPRGFAASPRWGDVL